MSLIHLWQIFSQCYCSFVTSPTEPTLTATPSPPPPPPPSSSSTETDENSSSPTATTTDDNAADSSNNNTDDASTPKKKEKPEKLGNPAVRRLAFYIGLGVIVFRVGATAYRWYQSKKRREAEDLRLSQQKRDVVYFHTAPRSAKARRIFQLSIPCLRIWLYLKSHRETIKHEEIAHYEQRFDESDDDLMPVPCIEINGEKYRDAATAIEFLESKFHCDDDHDQQNSSNMNDMTILEAVCDRLAAGLQRAVVVDHNSVLQKHIVKEELGGVLIGHDAKSIKSAAVDAKHRVEKILDARGYSQLSAKDYKRDMLNCVKVLETFLQGKNALLLLRSENENEKDAKTATAGAAAAAASSSNKKKSTTLSPADCLVAAHLRFISMFPDIGKEYEAFKYVHDSEAINSYLRRVDAVIWPDADENDNEGEKQPKKKKAKKAKSKTSSTTTKADDDNDGDGVAAANDE